MIKLRQSFNFSTIIHHGHRHVAPSHGLIDIGMEVYSGLSGASRINYLSCTNHVIYLLFIYYFNPRLFRCRPLNHLMSRNYKIILLLFLYFYNTVLKNFPNVTILSDYFEAAPPV
jgi:hypothetical protein